LLIKAASIGDDRVTDVNAFITDVEPANPNYQLTIIALRFATKSAPQRRIGSNLLAKIIRATSIPIVADDNVTDLNTPITDKCLLLNPSYQFTDIALRSSTKRAARRWV